MVFFLEEDSTMQSPSRFLEASLLTGRPALPWKKYFAALLEHEDTGMEKTIGQR